MAIRTVSAEGSKILSGSNKSLPSGTDGSTVKSNGWKPDVEEIRSRAYEMFLERQSGSEIGDWLKLSLGAVVAADVEQASKRTRARWCDAVRQLGRSLRPEHERSSDVPRSWSVRLISRARSRRQSFEWCAISPCSTASSL
jgi:hypothetical protein